MKYLLLLIAVGAILISGCDDSGVNTIQEKQVLVSEGKFPIPNQINTTWWKAESNGQSYKRTNINSLNKQMVSELYNLLEEYSSNKKSPYVAFLSRKMRNKKNEEKFKYKYYKISPNDNSLQEAEGQKTFYYHIFVDPNNSEIYQILGALYLILKNR